MGHFALCAGRPCATHHIDQFHRSRWLLIRPPRHVLIGTDEHEVVRIERPSIGVADIKDSKRDTSARGRFDEARDHHTRFETDETEASGILYSLAEEQIFADAHNVKITGRRTYYGQTFIWTVDNIRYDGSGHTWEAILYTAERGGQSVIGRLYATIYEGTAYIMWVETLNDDNAPAIFADIFEPMLDGFLIGTPQE